MPFYDDDYSDTARTWYDTALVCVSGHEVNQFCVSAPEYNSPFCRKCGAPTIRDCPGCGAAIWGYLHVPNVADLSGYEVPAHCHACGRAYPWLECRIAAAKELADELSKLSQQERETLKNSIADLVVDTPRTTVAATRFKRLVSKGGQVAADGFRSILTSVLTEAAKKILFP